MNEYKPDSYLVERCLILKLLKDHPSTSRYRINILMKKLGFNFQFNIFYRLIKKLEGQNLIVAQERRTSWRRCYHGHSRKNKEKVEILYSITSAGVKELFKLQFKIQIALTTSINGERI